MRVASAQGAALIEPKSKTRMLPWRLGLTLFACLLWCGGALGEENPPAQVARISYLDGNVSFLPAGQDQWSLATLNFIVTNGDRIYTEVGARAEIDAGIYTVRLADDTELAITRLDEKVMQLGLERGTIRVIVHRLPSDNTVEIDTPNAALTVLEPGSYRVDKDEDDNSTLVRVDRGRLEVSAGEVTQDIKAGHAVQVTGPDPADVTPVEMPSSDSFDEWSEKRDQRLASSRSERFVSTSTPGYAELDAYGRWEDIAEYGPVWFPPVPVGWVPFRFGHWAWIDPWGWTWIEDEVWGFCPFHYGRWVLVGGVWGWLPGPIVLTPVYVPAVVAFLGGPHFSVGLEVGLVGWFPLGPAEPFFPWYHYSFEYLQQVNITNIRNVTNITNILNETNINNIHYKYRTIATTAVPASVLSNGEPVSKHVVHLSPEQLSKAQVVPHPPVNPTPRAVAPGRPVSPPPAHAIKSVARSRPVPLHPPHPVPPVTRTPMNPERHGLVTRVPPPVRPLSFPEMRRALANHPGRPLEPQQLENLRAGRPPGPIRDREFPPHPAPIIPEKLAVPAPGPPHNVRVR